MANPFTIRWLEGWTFQTLFMEGKVQVEAHGYGICLRTPVLPGESPVTAADRLVLAEDRRRRALHSAWLRGQQVPVAAEAPQLEGAAAEVAPERLDPLDTPAGFSSNEPDRQRPPEADRPLQLIRLSV